MSIQEFHSLMWTFKVLNQGKMTLEEQGMWFGEAHRVYWELVASEMQELSQHKGAICQSVMVEKT